MNDNYDVAIDKKKFKTKIGEEVKPEHCQWISDTGSRSTAIFGEEEEMIKMIDDSLHGQNDVFSVGKEQKDFALMVNGHSVPLFSTKEQAENFGLANNVVFDFPVHTDEGEVIFFLPFPNKRYVRWKKWQQDMDKKISSQSNRDWFDFEVEALVTTKQRQNDGKYSLAVGERKEYIPAPNRLKAEEYFADAQDKVDNGKVIQIKKVRKIKSINTKRKKVA